MNAQIPQHIALNASEVPHSASDTVDDETREGFIEISDDIAQVIEKLQAAENAVW